MNQSRASQSTVAGREAHVGLSRPTNDAPFALSLRGYDRGAVDHFVHGAESEITQLKMSCDALIQQNAQLRRALAESDGRASQGSFSGLGGRAQEILRIAEEQAYEVTECAVRQADELTEHVEAEADRLRADTACELTAIRTLQLRELESMRQRNEQDAAEVLGRVCTEADQVLAVARLQAEAIRTESQSQATHRTLGAQREVEALLAATEVAATTSRKEASEQREQVLIELRGAQEEADDAVQKLLSEATAQLRQATDHLTAETEAAARLRTQALAEAEALRVQASAEARQIIERAQQQAAAIDERARQEFGWRRRQMRHEQASADPPQAGHAEPAHLPQRTGGGDGGKSARGP